MVITTRQPSAGRQIRGFLLVALGGVFVALIAVGFLVYYYDLSGRHFVRNILMPPAAMGDVSVYLSQSPGIMQTAYRFHHVDYLVWDPVGRRWQESSVDRTSYSRFYRRVGGERSVDLSRKDPEAAFAKGPAARLVIYGVFRDSSKQAMVPVILQEVQFARSGDLFRVEMRADATDQPWAYFERQDVIEEADHLFGVGA